MCMHFSSFQLLFILHTYYRPQRSCGQGYVFTRVCDSVNGGVSGEPPQDQADPPARGEPPRDQADTPLGPRRPPGPGRPLPPGPGRPPRTRQTLPRPREEDCSILSMSGRYASYWNAFLFSLIFLLILIYLIFTVHDSIPDQELFITFRI